MSDKAWLKGREMDASKEIQEAERILKKMNFDGCFEFKVV